MLTGKQKGFLRSEAHHLQPIFQIGKSGLTESVIIRLMKRLKQKN